MLMEKNNTSPHSVYVSLKFEAFCGICRRQCHFEFNTVFLKSMGAMIHQALSPGGVDWLPLLILPRV